MLELNNRDGLIEFVVTVDNNKRIHIANIPYSALQSNGTILLGADAYIPSYDVLSSVVTLTALGGVDKIKIKI